MRSALATVASAAVLIGAPSADAAQRFAAPGGSGSACSQAVPCSLEQAITKAATNDEVIVTTGTYPVAEPLFPPPLITNVNIHGDTSAPMPKVVGSTGGGVPVGMSAGGRLSYMEITNSGSFSSTAICNPGGLIERVRLMGSGEGATGLTINGNCTARDSVVRVDGLASIAVFAYGYSPSTAMGTARNLTVIATGSKSTGIAARYTEEFKSGSYTLDLKNSIASGEGSDLSSRPNPEGPANIVVSNSNFDVTTPEGTGTIGGASNQTAPPVFVDAATGNYREAPGSPTIDAGVADQIGALDLEGNPRNQGAAPDIGAFEFASPSARVTAIESLSVKPKVFRAVNAGGAIFSRTRNSNVPAGTTVSFALSSAGTVGFRVERAVTGRRVGKKCAKQTRSNSDHKKCTLFRKRKGGFTDNGAAGQNRFKFSGRLSGKALKPGSYRLVASVGDSVKRARFKIVR